MTIIPSILRTWGAPLLLLPSLAMAQPIRVCVDGQDHPPMLLGGGREGSVQLLVRMAAEKEGLQLAYEIMPVARCRKSIEEGVVDASAAVSYQPGNLGIAVFPMGPDGINKAAAVGAARVVIVRPKGGKVRWDGKNITGLDKPLLTQVGQMMATEKLRAMKVPFDAAASSAVQNTLKLLAGRGDAMLLPEGDALLVMKDPDYAGRLEVLPIPFYETSFYFAVSQKFYQARRADTERLWAAIARVRKSPEYQRALRALP